MKTHYKRNYHLKNQIKQHSRNFVNIGSKLVDYLPLSEETKQDLKKSVKYTPKATEKAIDLYDSMMKQPINQIDNSQQKGAKNLLNI